MAKRHAFNSLEFHDEPHRENLAGLKNLLSQTELNVNGMNVRMGDTFGCAAIPDQSDKAKNEIKDAIKIAEDLGARALHILSGVTEYNQTSINTFISNLKFALDNGFYKENLLTKKAEKKWKEWMKKSAYKPIINTENHDTIGLLAIDKRGDISGACTTSGLSWKMHGRIGDSPVIGAGMFVDNNVGGCCATGVGEAVLKTLGSFLIVELMRQGASPQEACEEGIARIVKTQNYKEMQIGYLAINKKGEHGAYAVHPSFNYALYQKKENRIIDALSYLK